MQVLGWMSILIGLLHFGKVAGILLSSAGIAVVYVVRKSKIDEFALTRRVFQTTIRKTVRRNKKVREMARRQKGYAFPASTLPTQTDFEAAEKSRQESDWFIYTN